MPDSQNRMDNVFKKYDDMSTEELQQILREDASKPEGEETNMEALLYVMKVLANRRQALNEGKSPEEALGSFMQNYYVEDDKSSGSERKSSNQKHNPGFRRWMSGLIAAAAMFVLILGSSLTASALGFDLWDIIVKWTQETFHFGIISESPSSNEPVGDNTLIFSELQVALDNYEIDVALAPRWIPEGYILESVQTYETPMQRQIVAMFRNGSKEIKVWIADYLNSHPTQIEQSDSTVEVYISDGIQYYIVEDTGSLQAAWVNENYECYISGPLTLLEIKEMIDSIKKG